MSKSVLTLDSGSSLERAVDLMVAHEVGSVVVMSGGKPLGIFAERDLLAALEKGQRLEDCRVERFMSPSLAGIAPDLDAGSAARSMVRSRGRLLVVEDGRMVGMVTTSDMLKVIFRTGALFDIDDVVSKELVKAETRTPLRTVVRLMGAKGVGSVIVTELRASRAIFTERDLLSKVLFLHRSLDEAVGAASTFPLITAEVGINGREAAGAMVARRIKRLPLTEGGRIVGVVTGRDLVHAFAYPHGIENADLEAQYVVRYGETCPLCNTRIDERNLCGCGAGGE